MFFLILKKDTTVGPASKPLSQWISRMTWWPPRIWTAFTTSSESWKLSSEFYLLRGSLALWWPSSISWSCPATKAEAWDGSRWNGSQRPNFHWNRFRRERQRSLGHPYNQQTPSVHTRDTGTGKHNYSQQPRERQASEQAITTLTGIPKEGNPEHRESREETFETKMSTRWAGRYSDTTLVTV